MAPKNGYFYLFFAVFGGFLGGHFLVSRGNLVLGSFFAVFGDKP